MIMKPYGTGKSSGAFEEVSKVKADIAELQNTGVDTTARAGLVEVTSQLAQIALNVKSYGAKGDGTTNDTAYIASAISDLPVGGVLYFPPGTYCVDNIAAVADMTIKGAGWQSVIKLNSGLSGGGLPVNNCVTIRNANNVTVKDIALDGNRTNNATSGPSADSNFNGIIVMGSNDVTIDNVYSHSNGYHGCIMANVRRIKIRNSKFTDNGYRPFHGHGTILDSEFFENVCYDNGKGFANEVAGPYDGIFFFDNVKNVKINGNMVASSNSVGCIVVGGKVVGESGSQDITVSDNVLESTFLATVNGIVLMGTNLNNVTICGNVVHNCRHAVYGDISYPTVGGEISVVGNVFEGNTRGVYFLATVINATISGNIFKLNSEGGIYASGLTDSAICGNVFRDNGAWTPAQDGINLTNCSRIAITGNAFSNSAADHRQNYGVREVSGCAGNLIANNQFYQMVAGATSLNGTGSVAKGNMVNGSFVE